MPDAELLEWCRWLLLSIPVGIFVAIVFWLIVLDNDDD